MSGALLPANLLAYSLQVGILIGVAAALARAFRLGDPRMTLIYWRGMLAACILLPAVQPWSAVMVRVAAGGAAVVSGAPAAALQAPPPAVAPVTIEDLVLFALAGGFALRLAWTGLGLLRLSRYRRRARPIPAPPPFVAEFRRALAPDAWVGLSDDVRGPVTFGVFRPAVLLPESFTRQPEHVQRAVVCHELLHVARNDAAYTLAEEIAAALLWFHPGVWWLVGRIRLACEQAVDRQAIGILADRKNYLNAVLETAGLQVQAPGAGFAPPFLKRSQLVERVALIAKEIRMSRSRILVSALASAVFLFAAAAVAVRAFPLKGEPQTAPASERVRVGADVHAKMLVSSQSCVSPEATAARSVDVQIVIGKDGSVIETSVWPGAPAVARAAAECVKTWRYQPLVVGGQPVEVITTARVPMTAPGGSPATAPPPPPPPPASGDVVRAVPRSQEPVTGVPGGVGSGVPGGVGSGVPGGVSRGPELEPFPSAEPGQTRVKVGANVAQAKLKNAPEPVYPPLAFQARVQGVVRFRVLISETGENKRFMLLSGHPLLVPAAMEAVREYQWEPTYLNGRPTEVETTVDVPFRLPQ